MKTKYEIEHKLTELQQYCKDQDYTTEEMQGEIQGLRFALDQLGEDL